MTTPIPSNECRFLRASGDPCGAETYGAAMCKHHGLQRCDVCEQPATHADSDGLYFCKDHRAKIPNPASQIPNPA